MILKKKKIAVLITGQVRYPDVALPNIQNSLAKLNADYFLSTWRLSGESDKKKNKTERTLDIEDSIGKHFRCKDKFIDDFMPEYTDKIYGVKRIERIKKIEPIHSKYNLPSFYLMHKGFNLVQNYMLKNKEKYTHIVKIRPDLLFSKSLSTACFSSTRIVGEKDMVNPKIQFSDKFFICPIHCAPAVFNIFSQIENIWQSGQNNVGERLFKYYLDFLGIKQSYYKFRISLANRSDEDILV